MQTGEKHLVEKIRVFFLRNGLQIHRPRPSFPPRLIASLQTPHRRPQFDDVTRNLSVREESIAAQMDFLKSAKSAADSRCFTLESESTFLRPRCADLENTIQSVSSDSVFRTEIAEIEKMLKEEKDRLVLLKAKYEEMELVRFAAEEQANKYKIISNELKQQLNRAAEDLALLRVRDQRAQERIKWLQEEFQQKEQDATAKFMKLKVENQDYKLGKRQGQEEADQWKCKYYEEHTWSTVLYNENIILQAKLGVVELEKDSIVLSCEDCANGTKYATSLEAKETHNHCFIDISSDEEENHSSYGWEGHANGAELLSAAKNCDDYGESSKPVLSLPREGEPLVACICIGCDEDDDTIPIAVLRRKMKSGLVKNACIGIGCDEDDDTIPIGVLKRKMQSGLVKNACIGIGCDEDDDTIPIGVLKRKMQSGLVKKRLEANVRSKMNFNSAPAKKFSSQQL